MFSRLCKPDRYLAWFVAGLLLISCKSRKTEYYFATGSPKTSYFEVGASISEIVRRDTGIQLTILPEPQTTRGDYISLSSTTNCNLLREGKADFAIAQNDVTLGDAQHYDGLPRDSEIRSVIPLYPEIFFVIYEKSLNPQSLRDLIVGKKVALGPPNSGTARLAKILFQEFGIDSTEYFPQYVKFEDNVLGDTIQISCSVTGFSNPRIRRMLETNGRLFSLGDYTLADKGATVDGFCLNYPLAKPFLIPQNTYGTVPQKPVLTVAIDAVLLTRKEVRSEIVFRVIQSILENKQIMVVDKNIKLLSQLTENFDPLRLRFPLHNGARQYFERNMPSFLERYAESLGFIFSIFLALVTAVSTFTRWSRHRKKNRIDEFYRQIMAIQRSVELLQTEAECRRALANLRNLREIAFQQLIKEKLQADESFRIFITLLNDIREEIEAHQAELKASPGPGSDAN